MWCVCLSSQEDTPSFSSGLWGKGELLAGTLSGRPHPSLFSFSWISSLIVFILTSHLAFPMARESSSYCLTCYLCPPKITLFTICSAFYIGSPGRQLYSYEFHFLQGINLLPILSLGFVLIHKVALCYSGHLTRTFSEYSPLAGLDSYSQQ